MGNETFYWNGLSFGSKFLLSTILSSHEKLIPSESIEFAGQAILKGFAVFLRLAPNHIPSVLLLFISRPEHF